MGPGYNPGMEAKRGRPQHPEPVTPAEARVLELLRSGKPNAEIAVRLGISVNTVRYHVSNLLAKAGMEDRRQLANWVPTPERASRRGWALLGSWKLFAGIGGAGLAVVAAATFLPSITDGNQRSIAPADAAPATVTPRATVIAGRAMFDVGPLFTTPGGGVRSSEARESLLVIDLSPSSAAVAMNGAVAWTGASVLAVRGSVTLGSASVALEMRPMGDITAFYADTSTSTTRPTAVEVRGMAGISPAVLLWAGDRHAEIGADGHLYIAAEPAEAGAVIASDTGERLDVSRATKLGPLDSAWTFCASQGQRNCFVIAYYGKGPVRAPFDGVFNCRADGVAELRSTALRLEFRHLQPGLNNLPCEPIGGAPHDVRAGDPLFPSIHTLIWAFDGDGKPVSLVAAGNGTLYAGDIPRRFGCPCRPGN